jgi:tetratricopeptide (TPR) repeat protein
VRAQTELTRVRTAPPFPWQRTDSYTFQPVTHSSYSQGAAFIEPAGATGARQVELHGTRKGHTMDEQTKQRLLLGREHYQKREFDRAEPLLRQVLEKSDRLADVHDMLGVICHGHGNFVQAEHHFERALAINPSYTEAALNLAVTYNDRGKYDAARQTYARIRGMASDSAHVLDPFARGKIANMHAEVAQAYADAGLLHDAITEYERAVRLCPQFADLRTKLGTLLRETNDLGRSREQYEAAVEARPNYTAARIQLGVTLLALGETDAAAEQWRRVLELDPDNVPARMYLRVCGSSGHE